MSGESRAVFLSYASEDAEAAARIATALEAVGVEVWIDRNALRGGDEWDQKIRREIRECALFLPLISAKSEARHEGYFRLEWDLADQRSHMIARGRAFIVPVCLDSTPESVAQVPESFLRMQWVRLPDGETPPAFIKRILRLLSGAPVAPGHPRPMSPPDPGGARLPAKRAPSKQLLAVAAAVATLGAVAFFAIEKPWSSKPQPAPAKAAAAFAPPPHSIAVLPFVNMSGDTEQEYFSDGLSEELLNSLARINELQVAARTSSFYFKGEHADLATIARKLNVATVLEGSVRRSGHTVRVTAQLNNAVTGFHLWSQTYDRDLGDVLKLQTEIADSVASALKVTLLGGAAGKVQLGGTHNPAAFDAYLRGIRLARIKRSELEGIKSLDCRAPLDAFNKAIDLDPNFALAYARRALARWDCAAFSPDWLLQPAIATSVRADAERAIELAPSLADGYVALSNLEAGRINLKAADEACTRALALAPNSDLVLSYCGSLAAAFGRLDTAIAMARRGVAADPLNALSYRTLGSALQTARRYAESITAFQSGIDLDPEHADHIYFDRAMSQYLAGDLRAAQTSCEVKPDYWYSLVCKAIVYRKLGRREDAAAAVKKAQELAGDAGGYQYFEIYAQWGEIKTALDWLDKAMRLRDTGLFNLKTDPTLDPVRNEPRFQAAVRELKFPD